jgi:hypothetical protein
MCSKSGTCSVCHCGGTRMYANTCWGFLSLAVCFGLAVLGLPSQYEWLAPWLLGAAVACSAGSAICFGWPLRQKKNRDKLKELCAHPFGAVKLIEPHHVVILGLAIAVGGVIWQLRTSPHANPRLPPVAASTPPASVVASPTGTGNPLWDQIKAFLIRNGRNKEAENSPLDRTPSSFAMGDASDGMGPYITYWGPALGPWPTTEDGFTVSQLRLFPAKPPKFTLQYDKEKFREAVEDFSKVINDKAGAVGILSNNAAGIKPLVARGRGRGAIDTLEKLQEISAIQNEVDSRLFAGGRGPFFDQYPRYKAELLGLMPNESQNLWVAYRGALYRFTNALMVVRQAEKHPEDGELFEYAMKDLDHIQDEFLRATGDLRQWVEAVNNRIDLMVRVI